MFNIWPAPKASQKINQGPVYPNSLDIDVSVWRLCDLNSQCGSMPQHGHMDTFYDQLGRTYGNLWMKCTAQSPGGGASLPIPPMHALQTVIIPVTYPK